MAAVHLIVGLPAAGKTTYSAQLEATSGGVHLSLDRWLITAFGRYALAESGHAEHVRRVLAMRELQWSLASELLRRDIDVILDDGFFLRVHRLQTIELAQAQGATTTIHLLDTPMAVLRERLRRRNTALPSHNFEVTLGMLDEFLLLFEPPSSNEGAALVVVSELQRT